MAYNKPALRERLKDKIMAGSKGGKSGQWSARKAQLLSQEYEKAGGGYTGGKTKAQKSLSKWTKEEWGTKSGKPSTEWCAKLVVKLLLVRKFLLVKNRQKVKFYLFCHFA